MKQLLALLICSLIISTTNADDQDQGLELGLGFGGYFYGDSNLDDASMTVFSLGYRFDDRWSAEIIRGNPDTNLLSGNQDIDVDWTAVRGLYNIGIGDKITTYLSAGVDANDVFSGENQVVIGLGIKGNFSNNFFWRLEGNIHTSESDYSAIAMLGYRFGGKAYTAPKIADSDSDGVLDNVDACPRTPAGDTVDHTGCTVQAVVSQPIDSDMDGVFDADDQCPNTPAKALVDNTGCQKELMKEVSVNLQIHFDSDQAVVKTLYFSEIKRVATFMISYPGTAVIIEGHTDSQGKAAHNQALSSRRADSVAKVLMEEFGIHASRIESVGHGEEKPIADNGSAKGRSVNRRVVALIKQEVSQKQWK